MRVNSLVLVRRTWAQVRYGKSLRSITYTDENGRLGGHLGGDVGEHLKGRRGGAEAGDLLDAGGERGAHQRGGCEEGLDEHLCFW